LVRRGHGDGCVERAAIAPLHGEVVNSWKEVMSQASALGLADRIVIAVKLKARAEALATYEGLARGAGDLAMDARAFAAAVKARNPLTRVFWVVGLASGALGFLGLWSFSVVMRVFSASADAAEAGVDQTTAALMGFLAVESGTVIFALVRGAVVAGKAALEALENFSNKQHPSSVLLQEVRPAEQRLFAVFQQRVPEPPISAGSLIGVAVGGVVAGLMFAAFVGVGPVQADV
jgi:hypothetical protein